MSIDARIQAYFALQGKALDMVDSTGRVYAEECGARRCGSKVRHWKPTEEEFVCGRCGEGWPHEDVLVPKGVVQRSPRPGECENQLAGLAHLGWHLNRMLRDPRWRWWTQVLVGFAVTSTTYADIADHANLWDWPTRRGGPWTESMAETAARRARRELRRRMRDASAGGEQARRAPSLSSLPAGESRRGEPRAFRASPGGEQARRAPSLSSLPAGAGNGENPGTFAELRVKVAPAGPESSPAGKSFSPRK